MVIRTPKAKGDQGDKRDTNPAETRQAKPNNRRQRSHLRRVAGGKGFPARAAMEEMKTKGVVTDP
jgi:hypothetical protein